MSNLDLNNVKLVKDEYQVKNIFIDDKEVKGVTKITYSVETDTINTVIIEMFVNKLEIEECNGKEKLNDKIKELVEEVKRLKGEISIYENDKKLKEWERIYPYRIQPYIPPKVWHCKYDNLWEYENTF